MIRGIGRHQCGTCDGVHTDGLVVLLLPLLLGAVGHLQPSVGVLPPGAGLELELDKVLAQVREEDGDDDQRRAHQAELQILRLARRQRNFIAHCFVFEPR